MNLLLKNGILLFLVFCPSIGMNAQSVLGKWKTIDDHSGETKSVVKIYEKDGKVFGDIVHVFSKDTCTSNADKKHKYEGMTIIRDMEKKGNQYENGTLMDPGSGKEYKAKIWLNSDNPNVLNVRGYVGIFYRTQNWIRLEKIDSEKSN